jgi:hypothetical protein
VETDNRIAWMWTFRDERAVRLMVYEEQAEALEAAGLSVMDRRIGDDSQRGEWRGSQTLLSSRPERAMVVGATGSEPPTLWPSLQRLSWRVTEAEEI